MWSQVSSGRFLSAKPGVIVYCVFESLCNFPSYTLIEAKSSLKACFGQYILIDLQ